MRARAQANVVVIENKEECISRKRKGINMLEGRSISNSTCANPLFSPYALLLSSICVQAWEAVLDYELGRSDTVRLCILISFLILWSSSSQTHSLR